MRRSKAALSALRRELNKLIGDAVTGTHNSECRSSKPSGRTTFAEMDVLAGAAAIDAKRSRSVRPNPWRSDGCDADISTPVAWLWVEPGIFFINFPLRP
jgi:hypothetical protein